MEQLQQRGDGGAGRWRGQRRVEGRRHIDLPAGGHGQPGFQLAIRCFRVHEHGGGVGRPGAGESAGAKGGIRPAQPPAGGSFVPHGGDGRPVAGQVGLVGLDGRAGGISVVQPVIIVGVFADALQTDIRRQVGPDNGVRFVEQLAQNMFRLPIFGDGGKQLVGQVRRRRNPARHRAVGDTSTGQPVNQLRQLLPDSRFQRG